MSTRFGLASTVSSVLILLAGCGYNPNPKNGKLPCTEGCPSGYECHADNRCWRTGSPGPDGGADAGLPAEAGVPAEVDARSEFEAGFDGDAGRGTDAGTEADAPWAEDGSSQPDAPWQVDLPSEVGAVDLATSLDAAANSDLPLTSTCTLDQSSLDQCVLIE